MNSKCSVQTLSIKASTLMMNFGHDTLIVSFRLAQPVENHYPKNGCSLSLKEKASEFIRLKLGAVCLFGLDLHKRMSECPQGYSFMSLDHC